MNTEFLQRANTAPREAHAVPVLAVTPGEPAGVGPDLCTHLTQFADQAAMVLIGDDQLFAQRAAQLGGSLPLRPWLGTTPTPGLYAATIPTARPVQAGKLDPANAPYVLSCLDRAISGCLAGEFDALVTGPVHKGNINDAGIAFTGHTEYLAEKSGAPQPVMMLACPTLRVALATIHLPLKDVSRHITRARLSAVLQVLHRDLQQRFAIARPAILVCGLNPHAGESGHLGHEEIDVIIPTLEELRVRGLDLRGPVPADTAFLPTQLAGIDAVLAMYHDQGLPVIKRHDFDHTVNVTLGLPFVRTSVDHGTALELAGSGRADPSSLLAATGLALQLVHSAAPQASSRRP